MEILILAVIVMVVRAIIGSVAAAKRPPQATPGRPAAPSHGGSAQYPPFAAPISHVPLYQQAQAPPSMPGAQAATPPDAQPVGGLSAAGRAYQSPGMQRPAAAQAAYAGKRAGSGSAWLAKRPPREELVRAIVLGEVLHTRGGRSLNPRSWYNA